MERRVVHKIEGMPKLDVLAIAGGRFTGYGQTGTPHIVQWHIGIDLGKIPLFLNFCDV